MLAIATVILNDMILQINFKRLRMLDLKYAEISQASTNMNFSRLSGLNLNYLCSYI